MNAVISSISRKPQATMIVTDRFAFMHVHNTGGQSLGHILNDCRPSLQHIGYYYPYHMLAPQHSGLPVVGMLREPRDWNGSGREKTR